MGTTVLKSLNQGLHQMMEDDQRVVILGEDVLDPYGGAFKVTRGLSTDFSDRVWTTPISEGGFVGVATGMAMRGLRPVVEIMFGDFLLLAADQLINHAAKFRWMYGDKVDVPLVVRAPMGGRRGYGPTHSQCLEKHFLGVPGLVVVAIHPLVDPGEILSRAVLEDLRPVLFVENKVMYSRPLRLDTQELMGAVTRVDDGALYPTVTLGFGGPPQATVVAYGGMVEVAMEAARAVLIEDETYVEVVVPTALDPLAVEPIAASVQRSGGLVVCEEACTGAGVGAEVIAAVQQTAFAALRTAPRRVGAKAIPVANATVLEEAILPGVDDVVAAVRAITGGATMLRASSA